MNIGETTETRVCKICGEIYPLTQEYFQIHTTRKLKSGVTVTRLRRECKKCSKARKKKSKAAKPAPVLTEQEMQHIEDEVRLARCKSKWHRMILKASFALRDEKNA